MTRHTADAVSSECACIGWYTASGGGIASSSSSGIDVCRQTPSASSSTYSTSASASSALRFSTLRLLQQEGLCLGMFSVQAFPLLFLALSRFAGLALLHNHARTSDA